jgi:hypothetical protein
MGQELFNSRIYIQKVVAKYEQLHDAETMQLNKRTSCGSR